MYVYLALKKKTSAVSIIFQVTIWSVHFFKKKHPAIHPIERPCQYQGHKPWQLDLTFRSMWKPVGKTLARYQKDRLKQWAMW